MPKPITQSKTFQGASLALIAAIIAACAPLLGAIAARQIPDHAQNIEDVVSIVTIICGFFGASGAIGAMRGRVAVGDVWTPHGLPGPSREDFPDQRGEQG